jgi:hypothetical protein
MAKEKMPEDIREYAKAQMDAKEAKGLGREWTPASHARLLMRLAADELAMEPSEAQYLAFAKLVKGYNPLCYVSTLRTRLGEEGICPKSAVADEE